MKFKELGRTVTNGEVESYYSVGNLTVRLTSRFVDEGNLEDALFDIALQRLRSQDTTERRQHDSGQSDRQAV